MTVFGRGLRQAWSSASADGIGCGEIWNWCPSGLALQDQNVSLWQSGQPNSPGNKVCSYLEWDSLTKPLVLISDSCQESRMTMCEVFMSQTYQFKFEWIQNECRFNQLFKTYRSILKLLLQ